MFKKKTSGGKNYEYYQVQWPVAEESEQWWILGIQNSKGPAYQHTKHRKQLNQLQTLHWNRWKQR